MSSHPVDAMGPARCCAHCGLPLGGSARSDDVEPAWCCLGCRLAATVAGGGDGPRQFLEARLLLATFLAMGVMTFSLVLYGESVHAAGDEEGLATVRHVGRLVLALFALPVAALLVPPMLAGAVADLRARRVRMDGLIVIATLAAYGVSLHAAWTGTGEVYFETATMVLVLVTFGRRLEASARTRGRDAAVELAECLPDVAHRRGADGRLHDVPPGELIAGDVLVLHPGESVPADVRVERGSGEAACAHLTGEQAELRVSPGDELPAGAVNGPTSLDVVVLRAGARSSLARLRDLLATPLDTTRRMRLVDRWAGWLAGVSILLAVVAGVAHARAAGPGAGLRVALSVLLVACPCALGLATPLAYRALRVALARHGVLVREAQGLEAAASVDHVVLDKTGTLTDPTGALSLRWSESPAWATRLRRLVGHSGHPLARSVGEGRGVPPESVRWHPGRGVEGVVDGLAVRAGSPAWIERFAPWPAASPAAGDGSLVMLEADGQVRAVAEIDQPLRDDARAAVAALVGRGLAVEILSGDRREAARAVERHLGVPCRGGLLPEDKLEHVRGLRAAGASVLVAGDGVNDAPALREADVGVAVGSGTAVARAQADVELLRDELSGIPKLLEAARDLRRCVRGNLVWSVAYNGVALALAVTGRLHPIAAVLAMIASSLVVSVRSYRLLEWSPSADGLPGATGPGSRALRTESDTAPARPLAEAAP